MPEGILLSEKHELLSKDSSLQRKDSISHARGQGDGRRKQPNRRFGLPWHETCHASVFAFSSPISGLGLQREVLTRYAPSTIRVIIKAIKNGPFGSILLPWWRWRELRRLLCNLPPCASLFGRLRPLLTHPFTGRIRFTVAPFRLFAPSLLG